MKRKMISLLTILFVLTISVLPVSAASPRLADEAGLLSNAECAAIEKQLDELSTQYGLDVVIVTTDSTGSSTPMEYADDYFDYNDYTPDGVLLLVSMEERDWWISTAGFGIQAFTDAGIAYIGDKVVDTETRSIYQTDIDEIKKEFKEICRLQESMQSKLQ